MECLRKEWCIENKHQGKEYSVGNGAAEKNRPILVDRLMAGWCALRFFFNDHRQIYGYDEDNKIEDRNR